MPAEFAAAQDIVLLESIEVRPSLVDCRHSVVHVRRYVIAHTRPYVPPAGTVDQLVDGELAIRERRMRVAINGKPHA